MQCLQCNAKWDAVQEVANCPFCQAVLPVQTSYDANSVEGKLNALITQFSPEIYKEPSKFRSLILDLLNGEEIVGLLNKIIDEGASIECYKLKGLSGNEFTINYTKALDVISSKTYIPKDVITPAFNLLCNGLGLDVTTSTPKPAQAQPQVQAQPQPKPQAQAQQHTNLSDFKIINGLLDEYLGAGGDVIIPDCVTAIDQYAFSDCKSLTSVVIPNSVTSIGKSAFSDCHRLTTVKMPSSAKFIDKAAFKSCKRLTSIIIPNSVTSIEKETFLFCENLTSVVIPNSVTSIEFNAFFSCKSLTSIEIPSSVTEIARSAFFSCDRLPINIINKINAINPKALSFSLF